MTAHTVEQLLTQPEAAALCGVHVTTLIRARRAGDLTAVKFGRTVRYRPSDLARWADLNAVGGATDLKKALNVGNRDKAKLIARAIEDGLIRVEDGARNGKSHFPVEAGDA